MPEFVDRNFQSISSASSRRLHAEYIDVSYIFVCEDDEILWYRQIHQYSPRAESVDPRALCARVAAVKKGKPPAKIFLFFFFFFLIYSLTHTFYLFFSLASPLYSSNMLIYRRTPPLHAFPLTATGLMYFISICLVTTPFQSMGERDLFYFLF